MTSAGAQSWTEADDLRLREHLERGNGKVSWSEIARQAFPGPGSKFTKSQCMERWKVISKPKPLRGPWTKDEDTKLIALVARHGAEKWVAIANEMSTRTGKQCRERWHNHLDPTINKGDWTPEEDELIHHLYSKLGSRWAEMAKHLPGRPDNAIKNYWNASQIRQKRRRGESISSLSSVVDPRSDLPQAPAMSRSSSSTSLSSPRFTPYVRSSPMSKSQSEQTRSPSFAMSPAFSPLRRKSSEDDDQFPSPPAFASPYYSPNPSVMMRSQSYCSPAYSPETPTTSRVHSMAPPPPLHIVSRDLNKEVFDPNSPHFIGGTIARDTPPATPDRPPMRRHANSSPPAPMREYPFATYSSPPSPPSSATTVYHPSFQQVLDNPSSAAPSWTAVAPDHSPTTYGESAAFEAHLQPFSDLRLDEHHPVGPVGGGEVAYLGHSTSATSLHESEYYETTTQYVHHHLDAYGGGDSSSSGSRPGHSHSGSVHSSHSPNPWDHSPVATDLQNQFDYHQQLQPGQPGSGSPSEEYAPTYSQQQQQQLQSPYVHPSHQYESQLEYPAQPQLQQQHQQHPQHIHPSHQQHHSQQQQYDAPVQHAARAPPPSSQPAYVDYDQASSGYPHPHPHPQSENVRLAAPIDLAASSSPYSTPPRHPAYNSESSSPALVQHQHQQRTSSRPSTPQAQRSAVVDKTPVRPAHLLGDYGRSPSYNEGLGLRVKDQPLIRPGSSSSLNHSARHHPTHDLMQVDQSGRACLPGS